jgi:hypothetical protein
LHEECGITCASTSLILDFGLIAWTKPVDKI